jgi:hypothetical protein
VGFLEDHRRKIFLIGKVHAAATPPPSPSAPAMNNLDAEISRAVRAKAESMGVGY